MRRLEAAQPGAQRQCGGQAVAPGQRGGVRVQPAGVAVGHGDGQRLPEDGVLVGERRQRRGGIAGRDDQRVHPGRAPRIRHHQRDGVNAIVAIGVRRRQRARHPRPIAKVPRND